LIAVRPSAPVIRLAKNSGTGVLAGGAFTQISQVAELISHQESVISEINGLNHQK